MNLFRRRHKVIIGIIVLLIGIVVSVIGLRAYTLLHAADRIYDSADVPERPVAIIFGALVHPGGRLSHMLADRVAMGAELYHAGKVDALLMTGDNSRANYNEPEAMRQYALKLGVPDEAIVLDYAGFRTYDSCYRARDIFQVESAILVTQTFHLPRAILTCDGLGLDVVGVSADEQRPQGYKLSSMVFSQVRELPATTLAGLDLVRGRKPTYLGEPIPISPE
jgi:SanA protein